MMNFPFTLDTLELSTSQALPPFSPQLQADMLVACAIERSTKKHVYYPSWRCLRTLLQLQPPALFIPPLPFRPFRVASTSSTALRHAPSTELATKASKTTARGRRSGRALRRLERTELVKRILPQGEGNIYLMVRGLVGRACVKGRHEDA